MIRPLRKYHRAAWIILAIALPVGFILTLLAARRIETFYRHFLPEKTEDHHNISFSHTYLPS